MVIKLTGTKMKQTFLQKLRIFLISLTPHYWYMQNEISKEITDFINNSLDEGHLPYYYSTYIMQLNKKTLWNANYPYSYGNEYPYNNKKLPNRRTCIRLFEAVKNNNDFYRGHIINGNTCKTCGGVAPSIITTECPKVYIDDDKINYGIYKGYVDFVNGQWRINKNG